MLLLRGGVVGYWQSHNQLRRNPILCDTSYHIFAQTETGKKYIGGACSCHGIVLMQKLAYWGFDQAQAMSKIGRRLLLHHAGVASGGMVKTFAGGELKAWYERSMSQEGYSCARSKSQGNHIPRVPPVIPMSPSS